MKSRNQNRYLWLTAPEWGPEGPCYARSYPCFAIFLLLFLLPDLCPSSFQCGKCSILGSLWGWLTSSESSRATKATVTLWSLLHLPLFFSSQHCPLCDLFVYVFVFCPPSPKVSSVCRDCFVPRVCLRAWKSEAQMLVEGGKDRRKEGEGKEKRAGTCCGVSLF